MDECATSCHQVAPGHAQFMVNLNVFQGLNFPSLVRPEWETAQNLLILVPIIFFSPMCHMLASLYTSFSTKGFLSSLLPTRTTLESKFRSRTQTQISDRFQSQTSNHHNPRHDEALDLHPVAALSRLIYVSFPSLNMAGIRYLDCQSCQIA